MSNETKKNIKIIIPSSLDDEGARMLVIPLLREPVLVQDVYQPDQVMRLLRISKPRFYELTDLKQRNPLPTHNYGPGKRGTIAGASNEGRSSEAEKGCPNESQEMVSAGVAVVGVAESTPPKQKPRSRECLLANASTDVVKNIVIELYRSNAVVGDGGTADAIRKQIATGELVGERDHVRKGRERLRQIERILSKNPNHPNRALLEWLRSDLIDALGGI